MRKIITLFCFCASFIARGQTYSYWFDSNEKEQQSGMVTGNNLQLDIPTDGLSNWFHSLHIQVTDTAGNNSPVLTRTFAIVPASPADRTPSNYRYWFDSDEANIQTGTMTGNTFMADISVEGLSNWFHVLHYQVKDVSGQWSPVLTRTFAIVPTNSADRTPSNYRYWFDSDEANMKTGTMTGNTFMADISVEGLSNWYHLLHYQVQDVSGQWSPVLTRTFAIIPQETAGNRDLTGQPYRYWFDDDDANMQTGILSSNVLELQALTEQLPSGIHYFHLQVCDDQGNWSPALSQKFLGGNQPGVILPWGSDWAWESKYIFTEGRSNYVDPSEDANGHKWTDLEYDDSAWQTLTGPMANSSDRFNEVNYIWEGDDNCFNLRRTFTMDSIPEGKYQLLMAHDDGVKVYLNGQLVVEDNTYGMSYTYEIPQSAFVVGENILAIYVEENAGSQYLDYCLRYVETQRVKQITLNKTAIELAGGERFKLAATVLPEDAENKAVIWTVANDSIASVSQSGLVRGLKKGITTVTVASMANPLITATCTVTVTSDYEKSNRLPDVAFEFFYNAADYDETTHSIPNHPDATLADGRLQLTADLPEYDGEQLIINGNCQGYIDKWNHMATESGAYFYRQGQDNMTIIAKVKPKLDAESCDFISNRGGNHNYMFRVGNRNRFYLHTADAYDENRSILFGNDSTQVIAVRANGVENYIQLDNLTTGETLRYEGVNWGGSNNVFNFFNNCGSEYYHGGFYWAYYSFEYLNDDEVDAVMNAADNPQPVIQPEPYAVLSDNNTVLTFYYDNQKVARNGMSVSPFAPGGERSWAGDQSQKTIVFDDSFANCTTITSTADWFSGFQHLETIVGIENLNTQNVTDMNAMFYDCSSLTILDLGSFNTSHVTNMNDMFANSTSLTTIYVGEGWTTEATESNFAQTGEGIHRTFQNCVQLVGGAGTHYDDNDHSAFKAHIDYGLSNPGYFTPKGGYGMASKPTFTHEGNLVFVNSATEGATIRYTIDDVAPTDTTGIVYSDSIRVTRNCTIRAIATRENFTPSEVAEYNVDWFKCEMPTFAWNGDELTISTTTTDAAIRYTMSDIGNGLDTLSYSAPIEVKRDVVIRAWAEHMGMITSDTITLDYPYEAWRELSATTSECSAVANQCDGNSKVDQQAVQDLKMMCDVAYMMYMDRVASRDEIMQRKAELSALAAELLQQLNAIDYAFDGNNGVLAINGGTTLAEALDAAGGRDEVARTITAIVWNSTATLTNSDLQGLDNPNMLVYVQSASQAPANRDNVVIGTDSTGYTAKNIKLTDVTEGNGDFYCPIAFTAEMISYTHEYRQTTEPGVARGWETIAMPFTVQTIMHETKDLITPFGTDSINKHFWLRQLTQQGLAQARQIEANTPYLISMPNSAAYSAEFNLNGLVTFSSQNVEVPVTQLNVVEAQTTTGDMVLLQPNFKGQSATAMIYALNVGVERDDHPEGSVFEANYRPVRPFEAFTVHHGNGPAPQFISISEMNGDVTGIEDVRCKMSDGRGDNWYDLNGRKLQQKPTQKGVYLNNGRKVVVR